MRIKNQKCYSVFIYIHIVNIVCGEPVCTSSCLCPYCTEKRTVAHKGNAENQEVAANKIKLLQIKRVLLQSVRAHWRKEEWVLGVLYF